jgi:HlyD family secretion protein
MMSRWPFLVWLGILVLVMFLHTVGEGFRGLTGVVDTVAEPIAPLETARLISIDVELGQSVKTGDVMARMDTTMIDAQLAVDEARMLEAQGTIAGYQQNLLLLFRQFERTITDAQTQLATAKSDYERDTAELNELQKEQARRDGLLKKRLISEQEAAVMRPRIAALEKATYAYPSLVKLYETRLREAQKGCDDLRTNLRVEAGEDITIAIERKMSARLNILEAGRAKSKIQLENYTLRAGRDGVVSMISSEPGDVINAGEQILRIVAHRSDRVVGFLPEIYVADLRVGQSAAVRRQTARVVFPVTVEAIGPEVRALPGRVSPIRGQSIRGRRIVFQFTGDHDLIPGETVVIRRPGASKVPWFSRLSNVIKKKAAPVVGPQAQTGTDIK